MRINFQLPTRFEWALFIIAGVTLMIFDYSQNVFQAFGDLHHPSFIPGVTTLALFWITFAIYHIVLFIAYGRAIIRRGTSYMLDWVFGSIVFVGMFFLLVGGIGAMYYSPTDSLPFFFNIPQITVYHFYGILLEIIGLGYFIITE